MSAAQTLLDDMQNFITTLQEASSTAVTNATNAPLQFAPPPIEFTPTTAPTPYAPGTPPSAPDFQNIAAPDAGEIPTLIEPLRVISELYDGETPQFSEEPEKIDFGTQPSQLPEMAFSAPLITTSFALPSVPSQLSQVFNAPVLSEFAFPVKPELLTPSFTALAPVDDTNAPDDLEDTFRTNFASTSHTLHAVAESQMDTFLANINPQYHTQLAAIEGQLTKYLEGGTGLKPEIEEAIYNRARARNEAEAKKIQDSIFADTAARGFTLPGGAVMSALARARQDAANNANKTSNEIAITQAELEQKNLQFAVTTSSDLRKSAVASMLSYLQGSIAITGQAIEVAKSISAALVQAYDVAVRAYSVRMDAYKTEATVYDIKAKVAGQIIAIYQAEIQAAEAATNVDRAKVDLYRAQIGTLKDYADIYKTQVDAVVSVASLEKLKIDLFQGQVQAYSTQVQAKSAEWQGYSARLAGEETKVKIFTAQAQAFSSEVEAYKAIHSATSEKIRAEAARNSALLQELTAKTSSYEANIRAQTAVASGNIETLRQHYAAHKGLIDHAIATEEMKLAGYKANVDANLANAKFDVDAQVANAGTAAHTLSALATMHKAILEIYSGPAQAAAAGMTSLASINFQE